MIWLLRYGLTGLWIGAMTAGYLWVNSEYGAVGLVVATSPYVLISLLGRDLIWGRLPLPSRGDCR